MKITKHEKIVNKRMKKAGYLIWNCAAGCSHVVYYNLFERVIFKRTRRKLR